MVSESSGVNDKAISDANRLGLDYRMEAAKLPWQGPIWDIHTHIHDVESARLFFEVADLFKVRRVWTMAPLEQVEKLQAEFGDRLEFIAVPDFASARNNPDAFESDWVRRLEGFAARGCRIAKFWAAPRGRDFHGDAAPLDSRQKRDAMKVARSLGMMFMTHVSDPDTWFATHYKDSAKYGTKAQQYEPLRRLLDEFGDVPWIAAHMAGDPEHLDHLQQLLDQHPNLHLDTSATKWMVRELSKHPSEYRDFCRRNRGRVLFGSDIVASKKDMSFDLYASRWWALRTLHETTYDGPSPIVDPDLSLVDPSLPATSTAHLRGCEFDEDTLCSVYRDAVATVLGGWCAKQRPITA